MNRSLRLSGSGFAVRLFLFALLALAVTGSASAAQLTLLTSFNGSNGSQPASALILGSDGNFYGTTSQGGTGDDGAVFKTTSAGIVTLIHSFNVNDGNIPDATLVEGSDGNFYGTTQVGGDYGTGTVFKITPTGALTTLHSFSALGNNLGNEEGAYPSAQLVQGGDGSFYGTCNEGGSTNYGTVFKITSAGALTLLHSFIYSDGRYPNGLALGNDGNFYGTCSEGGNTGKGTVFRITPTGMFVRLHVFNNTNGAYPYTALIRGDDGNFYGTTYGGGSSDDGTVFEVTSAGILTTLHSFDGTDGSNPLRDLVQRNDGSLYGTASSGGASGDGTVFKITPLGTLTTLCNLASLLENQPASDGAEPGGLVLGTDGNIYGTTFAGGDVGEGTIFRVSLAAPEPPTLTSFTPGEGPVGSLVTLTGTGLDSVSAVRFHDASATVFSPSADGTQILVTVPKGAMKGTITVTNSAGSATTASPFRITYAPVITSFSPTSGPVGTVVTVTGTHLDGITRVRFHEADAAVYSSNAAGTQLTVTVPPGAKTGTITLDNRDALATTSSSVFTVTP